MDALIVRSSASITYWRQYTVSPKPRPPVIPELRAIKPLIKPIVEPVLQRLDRHEELLEELKAALDVQFKRTAEIQAQVDRLVAAITSRR